MPVDFRPTGAQPRVAEVRDDLGHMLDQLVASVAGGLRPQRPGPSRDVALRLKAMSVDLPSDRHGHFAWKAGKSEQLGEVVNQLATMSRLLDALHWVTTIRPSAHVVHCNPTTSDLGSDLEVRCPNDRPWSFEVSDTLARNANRKITRDIATLLRLPAENRRLLVTSGVNGTYRPKGHRLTGVATVGAEDGHVVLSDGVPDDVTYLSTVILEVGEPVALV